MIYTSFSLGGAWQMDYSENKYDSTDVPSFSGSVVEDAVPGYWEDMTEKFLKTKFFRNLRINPEYGIQQYPIATTAPDMALPNIVGNFFYKKTFTCENVKDNAVIYFGGVQNTVSVWLNGEYIGRHEGYSTSFEIKIPDGLVKDGENTLVLSVSNFRLEGYDSNPVSGITSRAASECTGGITDEVELRVYRSALRDAAVLVNPDLKTAEVRVEKTADIQLEWEICNGSRVIKSGTASGDFTFETGSLARWTPENPMLYTLRIICGDAVLERKFGVRRLTASGSCVYLNNNKTFLRGVCEHCYYPETVNPTHDYSYYKKVVKTLKKLGFNFIRFHTHVPTEEYMRAADELGILIQVESPNNATLAEWREIVSFCRRHTSVVIYCCGNELYMDDDFISHLNMCADEVHENTDALFSPMSAMRGLEYCWEGVELEDESTLEVPFRHVPRRLEMTSKFCDLYNSYARQLLSYDSLTADVDTLDDWDKVYNKPRLSHEICIDGTYTDLSLKSRYKGTRIGKTDMFDSIERHLEEKGLLHKAPTFFRNSCEWQRRVRKYCFEAARRCKKLAGFDFLGPIDTHWHTFGYDVGMMNEFYELKPGETVRNVLMYNSETVLLNDLGRKTNFTSGEKLQCGIYVSHYGTRRLFDTRLTVRFEMNGRIIGRRTAHIGDVLFGSVFKLYDLEFVLPNVAKPAEIKLYVQLDDAEVHAENEWELYVFPKQQDVKPEGITLSCGMTKDELTDALEKGEKVVILGTKPFDSLETSFRIALAGRCSGNLATVVYDHPVTDNMPHDGFCGWQFSQLMEKGSAVCFESDDVPFEPIIEVASTHKYAIRQAAMFEMNALNGKLLVCGFSFKEDDAAAKWLKNRIISYAMSEDFEPSVTLDKAQLHSLIDTSAVKTEGNTNRAFNPNDKTAVRKKK